MINIVQYPGVNAKVKAMMSKMLTEDDYHNLIYMDSVQGIYNYLFKNTFYSEYLEECKGEDIHRRTLERILKKNFINDYELISQYLFGSVRLFFKYLFVRFEIEDLKLILRTILIEHNEEYLKKNLVFINMNKYKTNGEFRIENYQDLLNYFKNTPFYDTLKRFEKRYKRDKNLFPIEMTLDYKYFTRLTSLAKQLSRSDYIIIRDLLGTQIDLLNIQWIYRIKKFYNSKIEEVLNYILPYYYHLSSDNLSEMAHLDNADDIFDYLFNTSYNEIFSPVARDKSVLFENYFLNYLLKKSKHAIVQGSFNIGVIIGYLYIKEYELRDIITIVEGVRYSLPGDKIKNYLIRDWM
jgi:V/A-type H+/Na+-transporting ATPase subunit C